MPRLLMLTSVHVHAAPGLVFSILVTFTPSRNTTTESMLSSVPPRPYVFEGLVHARVAVSAPLSPRVTVKSCTFAGALASAMENGMELQV